MGLYIYTTEILQDTDCEESVLLPHFGVYVEFWIEFTDGGRD
jgi:hypothetical protein